MGVPPAPGTRRGGALRSDSCRTDRRAAAGQAIAVICEHGHRSLAAPDYLRGRGFENVFSVRAARTPGLGAIDPSKGTRRTWFRVGCQIWSGRGEGWVLLQLPLIRRDRRVGCRRSGLERPVAGGGRGGGGVLVATGRLAAARGVLDLRENLTPYPRPLPGAQTRESGPTGVRIPLRRAVSWSAGLGSGDRIAAPRLAAPWSSRASSTSNRAARRSGWPSSSPIRHRYRSSNAPLAAMALLEVGGDPLVGLEPPRRPGASVVRTRRQKGPKGEVPGFALEGRESAEVKGSERRPRSPSKIPGVSIRLSR